MTGAQGRSRLSTALLASVSTAMVCSLLLVAPAGARATVPRPRRHHEATPPVRPATPAPWAPAFGVYAGPGAVASAQAFDVQKGGPVPYALDFFDSSNWTSISDPQWTIQHWRGSPFHMIFGVPMLPDAGASLATGATGAYDPNFVTLATELVAAGEGNAVLMIGWDPLQTGTSWHVTGSADATAYIEYWRHIVGSMRAVPGAKFQFEWNGGTPGGSLTASAVYPGNSYVNLIAIDVFDRLRTPVTGSRWETISTTTNGPDWFFGFAAEHHKPLVIGEWGLVPAATPGGGGDDVHFVRGFMAWCQAHHIALIVTWDYGTWALTSGSFPASERALSAAGYSAAGSASASRALESQPGGT
jgi:hypothetical protein